MVGFEITEDALLRVSGVGALGYCAFAAVAPKQFHDTFMIKPAPLSEELAAWRYMGMSGCMAGCSHLVLSARGGAKDIKKDTLKVSGAIWLALAAHNAYNAKEGIQLRNKATANAIGQGVLGALCLWKGFE